MKSPARVLHAEQPTPSYCASKVDRLSQQSRYMGMIPLKGPAVTESPTRSATMTGHRKRPVISAEPPSWIDFTTSQVEDRPPTVVAGVWGGK